MIQLPSFPKPKDKEGRAPMTAKQEREQLERKIAEQNNLCYYCEKPMNRIPGNMRMATRDHRDPQPRSCIKNDADSNIVICCWSCNFQKGSQRGWTKGCNR